MSVLFPVALIVEGAFGLGLLLLPGPVLAPMGVVLDEPAALLARLYGSALIAFAILLWTARRAEDPALREGVTLTLFAYFVVSGALLLVAQLRQQMNARGWIVVALHALFAAWFGYFVVRGAPAPRKAHSDGPASPASPDA